MVVLLRSSLDDASISSTLTVDRKNKALTRTVSFNLEANQQHANEAMCKEECSELWYRGRDYAAFKHMNMTAAKSIVNAESRSKAPYSYTRVLERTLALCRGAIDENTDFLQLSTSEDRRHLQRWAQIAPARHGIEKWAVRSLSKDKSSRRQEANDAVLDTQDLEFQRNVDMDEMIRKAYQRVSRPSRLFAAAMADAHAIAIRNDQARDVFFGSC